MSSDFMKLVVTANTRFFDMNRFEKKEKSHKGAGLEKSHNGVDFSKYGFGEKSSWCN